MSPTVEGFLWNWIGALKFMLKYLIDTGKKSFWTWKQKIKTEKQFWSWFKVEKHLLLIAWHVIVSYNDLWQAVLYNFEIWHAIES